MLLLSQDEDSILLGLELALSPEIQMRQLTPVVALSLFHPRPSVRDSSRQVLMRISPPGLQDHIRLHWQETHVRGKARVFYAAVKALGKFPGLEAPRFMQMAVRLTMKFPEGVAHDHPLAFLEWCKRRIYQGNALHLDGYQIPVLPSSIGQLTELKELSLRHCGLKRLHPSLGKLPKLSRLDISDNNLTELPDYLSQLEQLMDLRWADNPLVSFPKVLGQLPAIQKLDLDLKKMTDLHGLENCTHLGWLALKKGNFEQLPKEVIPLKQLQSLEVCEAGLTGLPAEIAKFQNLTELDLGGNAFGEMPEVVLELTGLRSFAIGRVNRPGKVTSLAPLKNLLRLTVEGDLDHWPAGWCQLPELMGLHLTESKLSDLPPEFAQLQSLSSLDLSENKFEYFPKVLMELPELMHLNFHNNQLAELPPEIGDLQSLSVLDLSHNPLTSLPEEIFKLKRLVRLDLQNTRLPLEQIKRLTAAYPKAKVRFG